MKTTNEITPWSTRSVSWWLTMLIAAGIIFIGARFIIDPSAAATGYGISLSSTHDLAFGRIKGIRDIFSGVVLLPCYYCVCAGQHPMCSQLPLLYLPPTV